MRVGWERKVGAGAIFCVLLCALAFPDTGAGGLAMLLMVLAMGAGGVFLRDRLCAHPLYARIAHPTLWSVLGYGTLLVLSYKIFSVPWVETSTLVVHDWGPHHAIVQELIEGLRRGQSLHYQVDVSTGESLFELYPSVVYLFAAKAAFFFDLTDNIPLLLVRLAILTHVFTVLGAVAIARRVAPWPFAFGAGLLVLLELGTGTSGGSSGVFLWGIWHHAVAQALWLFAIAAVLDALQRPRLSASLRIWIFATLGIVAHPTGIVMAALLGVALLLAAVLARDCPARRALACVFHVALAVMLGAIVWAPLGERMLLYAVHYGTDIYPTRNYLEELLRHAWPITDFAPAIYMGYLGILAAILSRRVQPFVIGSLALILLLGVSDQLYLLLDVAGPNSRMARFSSGRMLSMAKVPVFVCLAYLGGLLFRVLAARVRGSHRYVAAALFSMLAFVILRGALPFADLRIEQLRESTRSEVKDIEGFRELIRWARDTHATSDPTKMARLLYEGKSNPIYHLHALSGMPTASLKATSNIMLRERLVRTTPANLRRFNVRYVVSHSKAPTLGDPASEKRFGSYVLRERKEWDGQLARIDKGSGQVSVTRIDNDNVEIELSGTDEPALVALGLGYYPRWQVRDEQGTVHRVYASPIAKGEDLHVLSAWLAPGKHIFSPDRRLPSDGAGRSLTWLGALLVILITAVFAHWRIRLRVLKVCAHLRGQLLQRKRHVQIVGLAGFAFLMLVVGAKKHFAPKSVLRVGNALRSTAKVEAKEVDGKWQECDYSALRGAYRCGDLLQVADGDQKIINDQPPSWPYPTPVIDLWSDRIDREPVEFRITLERRLGGEFWAATTGGSLLMQIDERMAVPVGGKKKYKLDDKEHKFVLTGTLRGKRLSFTFLDTDTLDEKRDYPMAPAEPP